MCKYDMKTHFKWVINTWQDDLKELEDEISELQFIVSTFKESL